MGILLGIPLRILLKISLPFNRRKKRMSKCPYPDTGMNCLCVGCCPYGEPCLDDDGDNDSGKMEIN